MNNANNCRKIGKAVTAVTTGNCWRKDWAWVQSVHFVPSQLCKS